MKPLGMRLNVSDKPEGGCIVTALDQMGGAAQAGIQVGDRLLSIDEVDFSRSSFAPVQKKLEAAKGVLAMRFSRTEDAVPVGPEHAFSVGGTAMGAYASFDALLGTTPEAQAAAVVEEAIAEAEAAVAEEYSKDGTSQFGYETFRVPPAPPEPPARNAPEPPPRKSPPTQMTAAQSPPVGLPAGFISTTHPIGATAAQVPCVKHGPWWRGGSYTRVVHILGGELTTVDIEGGGGGGSARVTNTWLLSDEGVSASEGSGSNNSTEVWVELPGRLCPMRTPTKLQIRTASKEESQRLMGMLLGHQAS